MKNINSELWGSMTFYQDKNGCWYSNINCSTASTLVKDEIKVWNLPFTGETFYSINGFWKRWEELTEEEITELVEMGIEVPAQYRRKSNCECGGKKAKCLCATWCPAYYKDKYKSDATGSDEPCSLIEDEESEEEND